MSSADRASGYRRPCSSRVSARRVGTLLSFSRAGRRLYRSWTGHQRWCSTSIVDSFSFLILAVVCHAYPRFVSKLVTCDYRAFVARITNRHGHWLCWMSTGGKNQGCVRYGTGILGTGMDVVPNLPKCPVPVLMYRTYRSVRYRY